MKITSMQKMIAVMVLGAVVSGIAIVLLVLPLFGELDSLALQRVGAEQELQAAQAQMARLEEAKSRASATQADLLKIGTQMPDSPQLPTLIIELQDIANDAGVDITSFSPAQPSPVEGGQYTEVSLSTQLTSEWDDLLDYLRRLNKSTRLLRVSNITVNPIASVVTTETANDEQKLLVSLTTKAYVIGNNGAIAPPAAPAAPATPTTTP